MPPLSQETAWEQRLVRTTSTLGISNTSKFEVLEEMSKMPLVLLAKPMFNHHNIRRRREFTEGPFGPLHQFFQHSFVLHVHFIR